MKLSHDPNTSTVAVWWVEGLGTTDQRVPRDRDKTLDVQQEGYENFGLHGDVNSALPDMRVQMSFEGMYSREKGRDRVNFWKEAVVAMKSSREAHELSQGGMWTFTYLGEMASRLVPTAVSLDSRNCSPLIQAARKPISRNKERMQRREGQSRVLSAQAAIQSGLCQCKQYLLLMRWWGNNWWVVNIDICSEVGGSNGQGYEMMSAARACETYYYAKMMTTRRGEFLSRVREVAVWRRGRSMA